jgi:hypothetical protein
MSDDEKPAPPPPIQMVAIGSALINPQWQGNLVAIADNGGDLVMLSISHPDHGMIRCLFSRTMAATIRDWLNIALQAPVLTPAQPQAQAAIEQPAAGTAD